MLQSVYFNANDWMIEECWQWLRDRDLKPIKARLEHGNYRFRLVPPELFPGGFITKNVVESDGRVVHLVIGIR